MKYSWFSCVSFMCIAKWISSTYTYIYTFLRFYSNTRHYRIFNRIPLLYSRFFLAILYIVVCIHQFQPPNLPFPTNLLPGNRKLLLLFSHICDCCFVNKFICAFFCRFFFFFFFDCGVRECSNFIFLHVAAQLYHDQLLKWLPFLDCTFLPPLLMIDCKDVTLLMSCSIVLYFCYCVSTILFWFL